MLEELLTTELELIFTTELELIFTTEMEQLLTTELELIFLGQSVGVRTPTDGESRPHRSDSSHHGTDDEHEHAEQHAAANVLRTSDRAQQRAHDG